MSPQLFSQLSQAKATIKYNPYKNEVFSIGLIILELGILSPIQKIYLRQTNEVDR